MLSVSPGINLPNTFAFEPDKIGHAVVYGLLVGLGLKAYRKTRSPKLHISIIIVALSSLYGIVLEIIQKIFFPYRYFDFGDIVANIIGAIIGLFVFAMLIDKRALGMEK